MKIKTAITSVNGGEEIIRGQKLEYLIKNTSFAEAIFLLLKGELPNEKQTRMMNAILTSVIDHGPAVASALTARISASAKNPLHASIAAGLLGLGERHGVVIEQAMRFFCEHVKAADLPGLLRDMKEKKQHVMGYGHKVFTEDPRTKILLEIAKETEVFGKHCEFALRVQNELNRVSSKKLPLNADGCIAAILCDLGFDADVGNGVFIIARVPGLVAQACEEAASEEGIRRLSESDIEYVGKQ